MTDTNNVTATLEDEFNFEIEPEYDSVPKGYHFTYGKMKGLYSLIENSRRDLLTFNSKELYRETIKYFTEKEPLFKKVSVNTDEVILEVTF